MSSWIRGSARGAVLLAALAVAFGAGVLTGVVGSHQPTTGVLDEAAAKIEATAARPVDPGQLERAAVQGMLSSLDDRWSSYYTPGQYTSFQQALSGSYSGVGVWLRPGATRDAAPTVASVAPGSPAEVAGVKPGDVLVAVDARSTQAASLGDVIGWLRGSDGSTVSLTLTRNGRSITLPLTRASLTATDVTVDRLPNAVMAIRIHAFTRGVGRQVRDALAGNTDAYSGGIILDLRDNPGGLLDEAVEVASVFLDGGPVVSYQRRGAPDRTLLAVPGGDTTTPLAVLVDHSSASAAEVVAGALQDRNRAVIVGQRTFGKGSVQEPARLSDGSALELTVGGYLTPAGRAIDGRGIEPDVLVDPAAPPAVAQARAVEVLKGLMAALQPSGPQG